MKQRFQAFAVAVLLTVSAPLAALGLGKLEQDSALNERFEARIPLLSVTADELSTLKVKLADEEAFNRAGINIAPALSQLRFKLVEPEVGDEYIRITSDEPISEPFLNFLVELSWASGRIYREYTVLLDPPVYDAGQQRADRAAPSERRDTAAAPRATAPERGADSPQQPVRPAQRSGGYAGGDYGPVQSGETLWSIANRMRPNNVTTDQMMLALLRANPEAFTNNNINGLKRGAILQMPDEPALNRLGASQARTEVSRQHDLWEQARQSIAASPAPRGDSATAQAPADNAAGADAGPESADAGTQTESRLALLAADDGESEQQSGADSDADAAQKLALANEEIESLRQQQADLKDQLAENEALIEDLKRLIALKDDELSALQDSELEEAAQAASDEQSPAAADSLQQDGHTVNYPNGDPAQFISQDEGPAGVAPAPATSEPAVVSHTVNYPDSAESPADEASSDEAAPAAETAAEPEVSTADEPAATEQPQSTAGPGMMDTLAGLASSARGFLMDNLMIVGAALLALIALLAGMNFMRRRQTAAENDEAAMAATGFPDFSVDTTAGQTGSAADMTAMTGMGTQLDEDETPTEMGEQTQTGRQPVAERAGVDDDDSLFVLPEGEGPGVAVDHEEADDPLAEVNVLMAYEHFDQAESFVRNALKSDPDNVEYQAKLLEVFYAAGNKKKYEEAASDLRDMTGGHGEHWKMAVAMWQEMSPNRSLFEGGAEEDELGASTGGGGGIVDITSDTASEATGGGGTDGTSGGLDFDLGDSTGGGSGNDGGDNEMLDLTASQDDAEDDMLNLTAADQAESDDDGGMLDLTSSTGSMDAMEDTRTLAQTEAQQEDTRSTVSGQTAADDNSLDFSLDSGSGSDLLDVTNSGNATASDDDDILDITASGSKTESADNSLDFSLDDSDTPADETETPAADSGEHDNMLEFEGFSVADDSDDDDSLESGSATSAGTDDALEFDAGSGEDEQQTDKQPDSAGETAASGFDDLDLQIESYDDSADLDEIGEELDRLEQTLGTLSRKETTQSSYGSTSDALEGIDSELENFSAEQDKSDADKQGEADDSGSEFELSLDDDEQDDNAIDDDLSALSRELDEAIASATAGDTDDSGYDSDNNSGLDFDLGDAGDDTDSDELEIELDDGATEDSDDWEPGADLNSDDFSLETVQMDAVDTSKDPSEHGFELDFDLEGESNEADSLASIDMDSTVEIPKSQVSEGLSLTDDDSDGGDDEEDTLFVARGGDSDEQSLEDELTTKLDLAKAYVELGDADSARSILEEVMQDGNDNQKRQAGDLLQQL